MELSTPRRSSGGSYNMNNNNMTTTTHAQAVKFIHDKKDEDNIDDVESLTNTRQYCGKDISIEYKEATSQHWLSKAITFWTYRAISTIHTNTFKHKHLDPSFRVSSIQKVFEQYRRETIKYSIPSIPPKITSTAYLELVVQGLQLDPRLFYKNGSSLENSHFVYNKRWEGSHEDIIEISSPCDVVKKRKREVIIVEETQQEVTIVSHREVSTPSRRVFTDREEWLDVAYMFWSDRAVKMIKSTPEHVFSISRMVNSISRFLKDEPTRRITLDVPPPPEDVSFNEYCLRLIQSFQDDSKFVFHGRGRAGYVVMNDEPSSKSMTSKIPSRSVQKLTDYDIDNNGSIKVPSPDEEWLRSYASTWNPAAQTSNTSICGDDGHPYNGSNLPVDDNSSLELGASGIDVPVISPTDEDLPTEDDTTQVSQSASGSNGTPSFLTAVRINKTTTLEPNQEPTSSMDTCQHIQPSETRCHTTAVESAAASTSSTVLLSSASERCTLSCEHSEGDAEKVLLAKRFSCVILYLGLNCDDIPLQLSVPQGSCMFEHVAYLVTPTQYRKLRPNLHLFGDGIKLCPLLLRCEHLPLHQIRLLNKLCPSKSTLFDDSPYNKDVKSHADSLKKCCSPNSLVVINIYDAQFSPQLSALLVDILTEQYRNHATLLTSEKLLILDESLRKILPELQ